MYLAHDDLERVLTFITIATAHVLLRVSCSKLALLMLSLRQSIKQLHQEKVRSNIIMAFCLAI